MIDRAALVTRAMVELLVNAIRTEEFCRQLEDMLAG
jgi:hypothetical protein